MSKSLNRVKRHLQTAGISAEIIQLTQNTKTAALAATAVNCDLDQIAKSIIFLGRDSQRALLFLCAGGSRVNVGTAAALAGEALDKADAALIRAQTGFAIGGVAPLGHLSPIRAFMDPRLLDFAFVWAAAGTPHHMFQIDPHILAGEIDAIVSATPFGV